MIFNQLFGAKLPFILSNLLRASISILIFPLCLRIIGPDEFGALAGEYALVTILGVLVDYSVTIYAPAEILSTKHFLRVKRVVALISFRLILFSLGFLLILGVKITFPNLITDTFLLFYIFYGLSIVFDVTWLYLVSKKFSLFFKAHVLGFLLTFFWDFFVFPLIANSDVIRVVLLMTLPLFLTNIISFVMINISPGLKKLLIRYPLSLKELFGEIKIGTPIFLSQIISTLYSAGGPVLLNLYGEPKLAGIWLILNRLLVGVGNFATLPIKSSIRSVCDAWANGAPLLGKYIYLDGLIFLCITSIIIFPLIIQPNLISSYFLGNEYTLSKIDSVMLALITVLPFFSYLVTTFFIFEKNSRALTLLTSFMSISHLVLSYPFVSLWGFSGFLLSMMPGAFGLIYVAIRESASRSSAY
jgi:O-antigen/teichoic acid export membrane protein